MKKIILIIITIFFSILLFSQNTKIDTSLTKKYVNKAIKHYYLKKYAHPFFWSPFILIGK